MPRTLSGGERALYHALYPARGDLFQRRIRAGMRPAFHPMDDLIAFHVVFGKTVPDISLNAVANLGYAEGRWLAPVWPGRYAAIAKHGDRAAREFQRQVGGGLGPHEGPEPAGRGGAGIRALGDGAQIGRRARTRSGCAGTASRGACGRSGGSCGVGFFQLRFRAGRERHRWGDYQVGERIDHVDGVTVQEAEHMLATRAWQNTSK